MLIRGALFPLLVLALLALAGCSGGSRDATPTPSPVVTNWQITGQVEGSASLGADSCSAVPGYYQVSMSGTLNGQPLAVIAHSTNAGTFDFGQPAPALTVYVQYGDPRATTADVWSQDAGLLDVEGKITFKGNGDGSMDHVLIYPAGAQRGGAQYGLFLTGEWTCPPPIPIVTLEP